MSEGSNNLLLEEEKEFKKQYKLSLWWVEHRAAVKRLGYGIFMLFDAVLLLFVLWTFLDTYAVSYDKERRAVDRLVVEGIVDLRAYTTARAAEDLAVEDVRVFSIGDDRYDLYAMVTNANQDWWVEFDYVFVANVTETKPHHVVFLPGQSKPIVELAFSSSSTLRSAEVTLSNIKWHRVDHHEIGNYATWYAQRSDIEIIDPTFGKEASNEKSIGVSNFTVLNRTAFSFFDPTFFVLLKQGSNVVGVNRVTITSINSLETKTVSLNWFGSLPGVTTVEVIPDINFFDTTVYKQVKGSLDGDIRTRPITDR